MVLHESRLDALTHFFVARDSMYRQVYQHRVLQAVDGMTAKIVLRLRDLLPEPQGSPIEQRIAAAEHFTKLKIYADETMLSAALSPNYALDLPLPMIAEMTESWWRYHVEKWCSCGDPVLSDLSRRYRDRDLFKTIRLQAGDSGSGVTSSESESFEKTVTEAARKLGFDPRYYVLLVQDSDAHRGKEEEPPLVLLDDGSTASVATVDPLIAQILSPPRQKKRWLAVPREVKAALGIER